MAMIDFSPLQQIDPAGAFFRGQEAAQAQTERNMLRQQQMENMAAQRAERQAMMQDRQAMTQERTAKAAQAAKRQEFLAGLGTKMAEGGHKLDRPTLGQMLQFGMQTGEDSLIKLASEGLRALDEEDRYRQEATRLGLPGAAPVPAATPSIMRQPAAAAPAAPTNMLAGTPFDIGVGAPAPANALAAPPAAAPAGVTREMAQQMILSTNPRIREQGKALVATLEKPQTYTPSPDMQGYELAKSEGYKGTFFDYQRQLSEAKRPPAQPREPAAPTIAQIQDPTDPNRMITIDARRYAGGGIGSPGVIGSSGKAAPAAAADQKKLEGQQSAADIIDTLRAAYQDLDQRRAVPSEQRSVLSNLTSYIASTGVGQVAGRMAGTPEQTQRDVIQSARNQILNAVKNATGMSAQQLNSNVEFKSWVESLTDPTKSYQANTAILDNLEKFVASGGKYSAKKSGGAVTPAPASDLAAEKENARSAIAAGAPEAAVRKRFKEKTGQEL